MRIARGKDGGLDLDMVSGFERQMLLAVEAIVCEPPTWLGDPSAGGRHAGDEELREDWRSFVRPELEEMFARQALVLTTDVGEAREQEDFDDLPVGFDQLREVGREYWRIAIPGDHVEDWYGALNLARLTLEGRENFGPIEATLGSMHEMEGARQYAALHFLFYSGLQEALLHRMMPGEGGA